MRGGRAAVWSVLHPSFTVLHAESESFSAAWTRYDSDCATFHDRAALIADSHAKQQKPFADPTLPPNAFDVSSIPWISFTAFTLSIRDAWRHLAPIVTIGRRGTRDDRVMMPLAVEAHHAAVDGFHVARFFNELRGLCAHADWVR